MKEKWIVVFSSRQDPDHAWVLSNPTNETLYFFDEAAAMTAAEREAPSMFDEPEQYRWVAVKLQNIEP